jgi:hypothetical protein
MLTIKTTIRKNSWGEYVVRLWVNGVHYKPADYYAADKQDAADTAAMMRKQAQNSTLDDYDMTEST